MPKAPAPITSPPNTNFQPYDATNDEGSIGKWVAVGSKGGPASSSGESSGDFESGPSPWKQT